MNHFEALNEAEVKTEYLDLLLGPKKDQTLFQFSDFFDMIRLEREGNQEDWL